MEEIWCYLVARIICVAIYMVTMVVTIAAYVAMLFAAIFIPYWILRLYLLH